MASTLEFIGYVCDQIRGNGQIRYRKMFGEYMIYLNDKPILLVCDNTVYVKKLDALADLMRDAKRGIPYEKAKEHYILDIDNADFSRRVVDILEPLTSIPKKRSKKKRSVRMP